MRRDGLARFRLRFGLCGPERLVVGLASGHGFGPYIFAASSCHRKQRHKRRDLALPPIAGVAVRAL